MMLTTPGGRIRAQSSPNLSVISGVVGAGLATTVLPARRAGAALIIRRSTGKFHGGMAATTPSGLCCRAPFLGGTPFTNPGGRSELAEHWVRAAGRTVSWRRE